MTTKKLWMGVLTAILLTFVLAGCESDIAQPEQDTLNATIDLNGNSSSAATRSSYAPDKMVFKSNEVDNFPVAGYLTMNFGRDVDASTINTNTYKIVRNDTGEVIDAEYTVDGALATIQPSFKFEFTSDDKKFLGLTPDTAYTIVIALDQVKDTSGNAFGTGDFTYGVNTADLDYGFYFHGSDGKVEKAVPGRSLKYYDPSKPTIIYIHGWQPGTSKDNFGKENPFFLNAKYAYKKDTAKSWVNAGYNVALYYWPQFADEGEVKDAQAKLYKADNDRKDMRYAVSDGSYREFNEGKNVGDLIIEDFIETFGSYQGSDIKVVGHSLGNQLATILTYKISEAYYDGLVSYNAVPKRLVLLDPFWGKGEEQCVDGRWTGEVCREYVNTLIQRHNIAVEQYKSSAVGGVVADENLDMRRMTAFFRIWPDFLSFWDQENHHKYAYYWYAKSIESVVTGSNGAKFGAAASDADIRNIMNYGKTSSYFWYSKYGKKTSDPVDDYFQRKSGVNTW